MINKKIILVSLVSFGLLFGMAGQCLADAAAQLEQAAAYENSRDYQQAEQIYKTIVTDYPGTDYALEAQKKLAILYILVGKGAEAQATIDKLTSDFSEHSGLSAALYDIAKRYEKSRKYEQARTLYQGIVTDCAGTDLAVGAQKHLVFLYIQENKDTEAQEALDKLVTEFSGHPRLPGALLDIARGCDWSGRDEKAESIYQQLKQDYGYPSNSYSEAAEMYLRKQQTLPLIEAGEDAAVLAEVDKLITDFQEHPDLSMAVFAIGQAYCDKAPFKRTVRLDTEARGYLTKAIAVWQRIIQELPSSDSAPKAYYFSAVCYRRLGEYEQAKSLFEQIVQQYPDSSLYTHRAELDVPKCQILSLFNSGNDVAAQQALDSLITNFSDHTYLPEAVYVIGADYYIKALWMERDGNDEQAKECYRKAIAIWQRIMQELPSSAFTPPQLYYYAAFCHRRLGEYEQAIEYYQKVVSDWPDYEYTWNAQFMIGHSYESLEKTGAISKSEADVKIRAAYEQLLKEYPDCKAVRIAQRWLSRQGGSK